MIFASTKIFFVLLSINLVNLLIIDDECYHYYSIFGIHINNIQIETCREVDVLHLPKKGTPRFVLYIEDQNKTEIFSAALNHYNSNLLMNKTTPIMILQYESPNKDAIDAVNRTNVTEFAPDLPDYSFYHNPSKNAAMVLFDYGSFSVIEGVVGDYTLRYIEKTQKYIWMKLRHPYERIPINWKDLGAPDVESLELADFSLNSSINAVNISTTVTLDNMSIEQKSPVELMKGILIYFNAINMLYANFSSPQIQMVIQALLLPQMMYGKAYDSYQPLDFFHQKDFPWLKPLVVLHMAITPMCSNNDSTICVAHGTTQSFRLYCDENDERKKTPSIFHIRHMDLQQGYSKAAQMLALALNASLLDYTDECSGIMNAYQDPPDLPLRWSRCTINKLSNYFRSVNVSCFRATSIFD